MAERKGKRKPAGTGGDEELVPVALRLRRKVLEKAKADALTGNRPLSRHLRGLLERAILEG